MCTRSVESITGYIPSFLLYLFIINYYLLLIIIYYNCLFINYYLLLIIFM